MDGEEREDEEEGGVSLKDVSVKSPASKEMPPSLASE